MSTNPSGKESNDTPAQQAAPAPDGRLDLEAERAAALVRLFSTLVGAKLSFLEYVTECDRDPTLYKVIPNAARLALRDIALQLSVLAHSRFADLLLCARREITTPGAMLSVLDSAAIYVAKICKAHGVDCAAVRPRPLLKPLAELRANLLVWTVCDKDGKRELTEADIPLVQDLPVSLVDRLYIAAARLNNIPLLSEPPAAADPPAGKGQSLAPGGTAAELPASEGQALAPALLSTRHSPDFRSVHWCGENYSFSPTQAACVKVLWQAWENGTPEIGQQTILEHPEVESDSTRLHDLFKGHPAWGKMLVKGKTAGTYRLAENPESR